MLQSMSLELIAQSFAMSKLQGEWDYNNLEANGYPNYNLSLQFHLT